MVEGAVWCMMRRAGFKLLASTPNHCIGALRQQGIALAYGLASARAPARSGVILSFYLFSLL